MNNPIMLQGGVMSPSGAFFLLCDHEDAEDDEVVLVSGQRDGDRIVLTELTDLEEIVSLRALSNAWAEVAEAACITAEGMLFLVRPGAATAEPIPGAGYHRKDALELGRMNTLAKEGNDLFALGFGGQVYRRGPNSSWQSLNIPTEPTEPALDPCLNAVVAGPHGALCFGGTDIARSEDTPELKAATESGDVDRQIAAINNSFRPNLMTLRLYDGGWRKLEFDYEGAIIEVLPTKDGAWLVFGDSGVIWRTPDFLAFGEVAVLSDGDTFSDVKAQGADVLLLLDEGLHFLEEDQIVPFDPPLPRTGGPYINISPAHGKLAVISETSVMILEGDRWKRLHPVFG